MLPHGKDQPAVSAPFAEPLLTENEAGKIEPPSFAAKVTPESTSVQEFISLLRPLPKQEFLSKMARTDQEIERLKNEAFERGITEGRLKGFEAGKILGREEGRRAAYGEAAEEKRQELDALHRELERTVAKVNGALQEWFAKSEPELAQVAILIAQRVLAKELVLAPEAILAIAKEAVSEITHATHARIKINPLDSAILEAHRAEILSAASSVRDIEIVEDEGLTAGCVIESDGGVIDATIETKLHQMLRSLRRAA